MSGENPYTTPAADLTTTAAKWQVVEKTLLVQNGAVLPEMDLQGGDQHSPLVPITRRFRVRNPYAPLLRVLLLAGVSFVPSFGVDAKRVWWFVGFLVLLLGVEYFSMGRVMVSYHTSRAAFQKQRRWTFIGWMLFVPGLGLAGVPHHWLPNAGDMPFITGSLLVLGSLVSLMILGVNGLGCSKRENGWYHIAGVPRVVIKRLARIQKEHESAL